MRLEKFKSNGAIINNKIKMLKTFNCLDFDILAVVYSSQFFLTDSRNSKSVTFYLKLYGL